MGEADCSAIRSAGGAGASARAEEARMTALDDDEAAWLATVKADRILGVLPAAQIAHLGDGFPWAVTDDDVVVARAHLVGARVGAIEVGRRIARLAHEERCADGLCPECVSAGKA